MATIGLTHVENPLEFGIVITRDDGSIERFLEKPTWGQVFSDTINTGIYVLEPEIFDYIDRRPAGRLLERRLPRAARRRAAALRRGREGYWEDVGTLDAYLRAHKDVLDGRSRSTSRASRSPTACGWARAPRSHPDGEVVGPAVIGPRLPRRGRHPPRRVHRARLQRAGPRRRRPRARRASTTTRTSAKVPASAARWSGGRATSARHARCEEGVVLGDECFVGENAVLAAGVKVYPFKTVEDGRRRQLVDRLGVARARGRCSDATASPVWRTSTSRPSSRRVWPWPTARRCEGRHRRHLA